MLDERTQLEAWWSTLSGDQKQAVLDADLDDIPGWIIASLVAAHVAMANDPSTGEAVDITPRAPQALQEFIAAKRQP